MQREQIVFVGTSDLSGHFRGKSFPSADLASRLERGVALAPTNIFLSAFGPIHMTVFGTLGEVFMIPDPATKVNVPYEEGVGEHFYIGDIRTLSGRPWSFCPRQFLRRALEALRQEAGLQLLSAFEQELIYSGAPDTPQPYELDGLRRQGLFGEALLAALRQAGVVPDSFIKEFGPRQFEVTTVPGLGMRAADDAVIVRELARAIAYRLGERASVAPILDPNGTGNGTHIHFSFLDGSQQPVMYDPVRPLGLSIAGSRFVAGILQHLPTICAVTAPSVASYYRLRPNRWAPVTADVGDLDRGAAVRICPLALGDLYARARQFNVEYRVADATASPYLALGALVFAGLDGIRRELDLSSIPAPALPATLAHALDLFEESGIAAEWFGADLHSAYVKFKRAEIASLDGLDEAEICRRYAAAY